MKLSKAMDGFFMALSADGYSKSTIDIYRWALVRMINFLEDKEIEDVGANDLRAYFSWLQNEYVPNRPDKDPRPLTGRSVENVWTAMRSFYNYAERDHLVSGRPDHSIRRPQYSPREIKPFSKEEVDRLCSACEFMKVAETQGRRSFSMRRSTYLRDIAILHVLLDTGIRASECARLRVGNVNLENGHVKIVAFGTGKKTKERTVYLGKLARRVVWRYLAQRPVEAEDPLFVTRDGLPMDRVSLLQVVDELGKRAGVENCHPHRFRHTFAIEYLRNGGDIFTLRDILGHSRLDMVNHYLQLSGMDSANAHRRASPGDNWRLRT